jgi:hypothetical protein
MAGIFALALSSQSAWLADLPAAQGAAAVVAPAVGVACLLSWLSQFRRRYGGSAALLYGFAALGLVLVANCGVLAAGLAPDLPLQSLGSAAGLLLIGLFCMVALRTRPASEHGEGAL